MAIENVFRRGDSHAGTAPHDAELLRPGVDPFYDSPADLGLLPPGTVIRTREVRLALLGLVPQRRLSAWQIAYRSNDLNGAAEVAVTTLVVPRDREPRGLIAYQCAIDAVSDRCFPSYAMRVGAYSWGALPQFEVILIADLLARGFAVTIADHEGRTGVFGAPREPGYRVLDGIRACLAADLGEHPGLDPRLDVGLFGYSGGGMASAWAVEMAPTYAPELPLVGAVLGSPVGDPGETFIKLNGGPFAGLPAMVVAGLRHLYPGLSEVIRDHSNVDGRRKLDRIEKMTTIWAVLRYAGNDFDDYLDSPLADVLATNEVQQVFSDIRLGTATPACPLLVVQSLNDQQIAPIDVDGQVARYEAGGAQVMYRRDWLSEHISLMVLAFPTMVGWLERRFDAPREPIHTGREDHFSLAFTPRSIVGFGRMATSLLRTAVGVAG